MRRVGVGFEVRRVRSPKVQIKLGFGVSGTRGGNGGLRYRLHMQLGFTFHEIKALAEDYDWVSRSVERYFSVFCKVKFKSFSLKWGCGRKWQQPEQKQPYILLT